MIYIFLILGVFGGSCDFWRFFDFLVFCGRSFLLFEGRVRRDDSFLFV